ncbi:MAG: hypothetical protein U1F57_12365 [bacterium]
MQKLRRGILFLCLLALMGVSGMMSCGGGGDGGNGPNPPPPGFSFDGFYAITQLVITSTDGSISQNGDGLGLSGFLTANADNTLTFVAQTASCPHASMSNTCSGPNTPINIAGTWKENSDGSFELDLNIPADSNPNATELAIVTGTVSFANNMITFNGKQTGGNFFVNVGSDPNRKQGTFSTFNLQKYTSTLTTASLAGTFNAIPATSVAISNADNSKTKPLLAANATASITLDGQGNYTLKVTGNPDQNGNYKVIDQFHIQTIDASSPNSTQKTQVFRFLVEQGQFRIWDYNDTNSFGTTTSEPSTTVIDLQKQ